ncbi:MAG: isochorismate synthase, partial [Polyangiales bacterium]
RTPTERGQGTERTQPMENSSWPLWQGQVAQAQRWIRRGKLDKVVLARAAVVPLEGFAARVRALSAVASAPQPLFAYAVGDAQSSLIGASPERLVAKTGSRVESEAVAGTAAASEGAALQHSAKDAREHAWVVAHLRAVLSQHCRSLEHAPSPSIWPLPGLLHLRTPFVGELSRPQHILTLVQALHPTPAVAGHPVAAALDAIETLETETRDIYAGPVGGFDAAGDGEFAVALRAAHFRANAAHLWAGAGLVRASDAAQEYAETALKLQAIAAQLALPQDALDPPTGQAPLCTSLSA